MTYVRNLLFLAVYLAMGVVPAPANDEGEISFGYRELSRENLFPGETIEIRDVSLTWEVEGQSKESEGFYGTLEATLGSDPDRSVRVKISSHLIADLTKFTLSYWIHLEDVILYTRGTARIHSGSLATIQYFEVLSWYQPPEQVFNAEPHGNVRVYVSQTTPITLNDWEILVSDGPVQLPDGSEHLQIQGKNKINGDLMTLPALEGVVRKFGRFEIHVGDTFEDDRVLELEFYVAPDLSVRGADAYTNEGIRIHADETLEEFLGRVGERFGFEVEWTGHPEAPDLVDQLKSIQPRNKSGGYDGIVSSIINRALGSAMDREYKKTFDLEWVNPTHLRVFSLEVEEVLERNKESKRRDELHKQVAEDWKQNYQLVTKVYSLSKITPVTAKTFIDQSLRSFNNRHSLIKEQPAGEASDNDSRYWIHEQSVADDKANAVIVTAIPRTHEKIAILLAEMDAMLGEKEAASIPERYRLEVILLRGSQVQTAKGTPGILPEPVYAPGVDYEIESLSVTDQRLAEFAQLLSELGQTSINVVPEIQGTRIAFNVPKPRKIRNILEDVAAVYGFRIEYRPDHTIIHPDEPASGYRWLRESNWGKTRDPHQTENRSSVLLKSYGISEEDLAVIGFQSAEELGRGVIDLAAAKGEEGEAYLSLTDSYAFEFEYMDLREPYLIAKGRFLDKDEEKPLLENTLYLEPDKPTLLGLTNLREALILVVKRYGEDPK